MFSKPKAVLIGRPACTAVGATVKRPHVVVELVAVGLFLVRVGCEDKIRLAGISPAARPAAPARVQALAVDLAQALGGFFALADEDDLLLGGVRTAACAVHAPMAAAAARRNEWGRVESFMVRT